MARLMRGGQAGGGRGRPTQGGRAESLPRREAAEQDGQRAEAGGGGMRSQRGERLGAQAGAFLI
jgi:hypothetical protein